MTNKLDVKTMIKLAIFTVVFYILIRVSSLVSLIPGVYPFTAAVTLIPVGIVWIYLRMKVKAKYSILIQCTLLSILTFVGGSPYFIALGMLLGGVIAEFITFDKNGNSTHRSILYGYIGFGFVFYISTYLIMLVARDYYITYIESLGMPIDMVLRLVNLVTLPTFIIGMLLVPICSFIGLHIGKIVFVRYFNK